MATDSDWANVVLLIEPTVLRGTKALDDAQYQLNLTPESGAYSIVDTDTDFPDGAIKVTTATSIAALSSSSLVFPASQPFTIEWTAKYSSFPASADLLGLRDTEASNRFSFYVNTSDGGKLYVNRFAGGAIAFSANAIPVNTKVHIRITRDASGVWRSYFNGVYEASFTDNGVAGNGRGGLVLNAPGGMTTHIGRFRVTSGVARSTTTASFTPPSGPWDKAGAISGIVRDGAGSPCARTILAYERATGRFSGVAKSDATTGAFSINTVSTAEHFLVYQDDAAGDLYNDLVNRVIPA